MQNDNEYPTDKMPKYHNLHYGLSQHMAGLCDITLEEGGFWWTQFSYTKSDFNRIIFIPHLDIILS